MSPHPETQSPIRLLVPQERDPGLVAANRRFMQSRSQARRLIDKTAQDERDAQAGVTPEMRALKEAQARENQITSIMENTGGTREEAAAEVDAQLERDLLRPGVESAIEREAARRGRGGLGRAGWREAFGRRKAREKQATDAVDRRDQEAVTQTLGVLAIYTGTEGKEWSVGGIDMPASKVKQKALEKARQDITQEMRGPFAPTMEERGRAGLRREAEEAMLPGVPVAPTKPKPIAWAAVPGMPGLYANKADPTQIIDIREPTADVYHMGDRLVEVKRDKAGKIVGKPRERYVKPEEVDYTQREVAVERDGEKRDVVFWIPNKPGLKAVEVEGIPWATVSPDPGIQEMAVYERDEAGKEVPVIVRVRGGEVLSRFYPTKGGQKMSAEMRRRFVETPKRYVSSTKYIDDEGNDVIAHRIIFPILDGAGKETDRWGYYEAEPIALPEEAPAETEAVEPTQPEPEESDLSQDQVNGVYDALRQERPDLDPKSEEFGAVLEKRLRALGT